MNHPIIDTHAHLQLEQFDSDRTETIQRAKNAGLAAIIVVSTDVASSIQAIELAEAFPEIYAAVGIHPNDCGAVTDNDFDKIAELAQHPKVVAIGEIGLDYYWKTVEAALQKKVFLRQLTLAKEMKKPVIIHNRESGADVLDILEKEKSNALSGVLHCFSEDIDYAERVVQSGFHISFTGNITYKKSTLPQVAERIPIEKLLLETDSPFMSPVPKRGKRNEPANTIHIAEKLAEIKGLPFAKVCRITTENAQKLFGLAVI